MKATVKRAAPSSATVHYALQSGSIYAPWSLCVKILKCDHTDKSYWKEIFAITQYVFWYSHYFALKIRLTC